MSVPATHEVTAVIWIEVVGFIIGLLKEAVTNYILKDANGRLPPMRRGLYEGSEKQCH